jgi:hypothetical protein
MPIGDVLPGQATILAVGDTSALGTEVGGLTGWSAPQTKGKSTRKYDGNTPTKIIYGPSEDTWSLNCDLTSGDTGQQYVIAKYLSGLPFFIGYADANGNGQVQQVTAGASSPQGSNPDEPNTVTYEFGGIEARANIGSGQG